MKNHFNQLGFGHLAALLVLLVLVTMGATGYFVFSRNSKKDTTTNTSQASNKKEEPNKQDVVDTYTYKEYCSETEKACFDYPSDWILTDNNDGKEFSGVGEKITSSMENVTIKSPNGKAQIEWNNFLSGLGGACLIDENPGLNIEFLSSIKVLSQGNSYAVKYSYKDSDGLVYYRLVSYEEPPKLGLQNKCANTFYDFYTSRTGSSKNILFEARTSDLELEPVIKNVIAGFKYQ